MKLTIQDIPLPSGKIGVMATGPIVTARSSSEPLFWYHPSGEWGLDQTPEAARAALIELDEEGNEEGGIRIPAQRCMTITHTEKEGL